MTGVLCVVCGRHVARDPHVCGGCRSRVPVLLGELPGMLDRLALALVPSPAPAGDRVSARAVHPGLPVRVETLSAVGPGSGAVTAMMHPRVRRWSTRRTVAVVDPAGVETTRELVEWHTELARDPATGEPVLVADDDQVGMLPPPEWLDGWVMDWRRRFGHHPRDQGHRPGRGVDVVAAVRTPAMLPALATWVALTMATRAVAARAVTGLDDGYGGHRPAAARSPDPLADEWEYRFGPPTPDRGVLRNVRYLRTWWERVCDAGHAPGEFASELRAVHAEVSRLLGEHRTDLWLGRCPARIRDPAADGEVVCGAGLWQDPYVGAYNHTGTLTGTQVRCPRCHTAWGPARVELLGLAMAIRRTWPLDGRRRYTDDDRVHAPVPVCRVCAAPARVGWREVTGRDDEQRWWRPVTATCPDGHPERMI